MNPLGRDLPFVQLRAFFWLYRYGSQANAALATRMARSVLSQHVKDLEDWMHQKLCYMDPLRFTAAGKRLLRVLEAFLSELETTCRSLQADGKPEIRFGASEVVARLHLPGAMERLEARFPNLVCSSDSATEDTLERWLTDDAVNFVVATMGPIWKRHPSHKLLELAIGIVTPANSPYQALEPLWAQRKIRERLYLSNSCEAARASFQRGLQKFDVTWDDRRQASTLFCVVDHVAAGRGLGMVVLVPAIFGDRRIRILPLPFDPVIVAAFWKGKKTPAQAAAIDFLVEEGKALRSQRPIG